jgi:hypothetical protein
MEMDDEKVPRRLALEMDVLREASKRDLPPLVETERALRIAAMAQPQGGMFMRMLETMKSRPRSTAALVGGALFAAVLFLPVSYERTVGHTVTVHVAGAPQSPAPLARLVKKALHAESVQVRAEAGGASSQLTLTARLPLRSGQQAEQLTQALLSTLREQKLTATAEVAARKERTSGRVYAMALDKLIRIHVDTTGKTDTQVADEIRNQLESSGVHSPTVSFERKDGTSQMQISADVEGRQVKVVRHTKDDSHPTVDVEIGGIDDHRDPGMTDDQLRDKIKRQLEARGLTADVTVVGDRIEIRAHRHP